MNKFNLNYYQHQIEKNREELNHINNMIALYQERIDFVSTLEKPVQTTLLNLYKKRIHDYLKISQKINQTVEALERQLRDASEQLRLFL